MLNKVQNMKRTYEIIRKVAVAVCALGMMTGTAWGQNIRNTYEDITIKHKPAKWHIIRNNPQITSSDKEKDTFSDGVEMYKPNDVFPNEVQATHTYIDTIYVHKGTTVQLILPTISNNSLPYGGGPSQASTQAYQRWYSFRTDGTFKTNSRQREDLLTPIDVNAYRFANGYVGFPILDNTTTGLYRMNFYFPTDNEYRNC